MSDIETRQKKLPVLLFIRGEQYFDDVDPDATELTTEGTLELTEEGFSSSAAAKAAAIAEAPGPGPAAEAAAGP